MIDYESQKESTRRIFANKEDIGQVSLKEYDFNLLIWQTAHFKDGRDVIDNYKMPERIGKWFAFTRESNGVGEEHTYKRLNIASS